MGSSWRAPAGRAAFGLVLLAAAWGLHRFRSPGLVFSWYREAPVDAPGPAGRGAGSAWPAAARVRVVLLDGLRGDVAQTLPNLSAMCKIDLTLDSGFPTVSLPVQHVLWTGLSQQQSGIQYRTTKIDPPPPGIPSMVPSRAVAEAHPEIVHSFGFGEAYPPIEGEDAAWRDGGFIAAAAEMVASESPLVFVHVLRIDQQGHRWGGASAQAREAAATADTWLGQLIAEDKAARPEGGTRWFVLADHGQRVAGGHGDAEPDVRLTRLCIGGDVPPVTAEWGATIHLVDLSRAIADSLGVQLPERAMGRPLDVALRQPEFDATLPRPGLMRWIFAALALLAAGWATVRAARSAGKRRIKGTPSATSGVGGLIPYAANFFIRLPLWWVVAAVCLVVRAGWPTLSNVMVWSPKGKIMLDAAMPGVIMLALVLLLAAARRARAVDLTVGQLALPAGVVLATLILSGGVQAIVSGAPPLMPYYSGVSSAALLLLVIGAAAVGLALLVTSGPAWIDRSAEPDSSGTAGSARGPAPAAPPTDPAARQSRLTDRTAR